MKDIVPRAIASYSWACLLWQGALLHKQTVEPLQLKLLSMIDEGSLDIDIVGRVPYHQAHSVEKT